VAVPDRDVVCIARALGAEGEEVGRLVAERLGFRYADEEIVLRAAERAGLDSDLVADAEQRKSLFAGLLDYLGDGSEAAVAFADTVRVPTEVVREFIRDAVREVAADGGVVIVAHAASHALRGERSLRVFVTAPERTRAERLAAADGLSAADAAKAVRRSDAARADYLKRFYGVGEERSADYDLVVNTEHLSADAAAALIVQAFGAG
jgi:Cytidylate kinase-like family